MNISDILNPLLSGDTLISQLSVFPSYDADIINKSESERLIALMDIYNLYIPSQMSIEIYSKLYLATLRSLQKKDTKIAIKQRYENYNCINNKSYQGIIGGSDSFTIIGTSGIGKSSAISRAVNSFIKNDVIKLVNPYADIIPCLIVQCPFDSSVKGLLLEILRNIDNKLNTNYYNSVVKSRTATTDMLIGMVSNLAINHIGLLIVDEIQNVVNSKNGKNLIGSLTQLINNSGISICMVGTPESNRFFEQAMFLARRSVGLNYSFLPFDDYFISFCKVLFKYVYVRNTIQYKDILIKWLYDHSKGITAVVVALVHDAQEIAILEGLEILDINTLTKAYNNRISLLQNYIDIQDTSISSNVKNDTKVKTEFNNTYQSENIIEQLVKKSKKENLNIIDLLKDICNIEEVCI